MSLHRPIAAAAPARPPAKKHRRRRTTAPAQLPLRFHARGGARPGAGRPRSPRSGVSHLRRPKLSRHHPVHVTLKVRPDAPGLRTGRAFRAIYKSLCAARERLGGRLVHYSVQHNHLHLLIEAADRRALSRAMQGLCVRLAKGLNRSFARTGRVFADRYHARALRTPLEVRRALIYVLGNQRKHAGRAGRRLGRHYIDPLSSAIWFTGWRGAPPGLPLAYVVLADARAAPLGRSDPRAAPGAACEVAEPRTYLLRRGWRRHGLIGYGAAE